MTWFVDASVVVAILGCEKGWEAHADRLDSDDTRLWSPLSQWECTAGLRSRLETTVEYARTQVIEFARENGFTLIRIGADEVAVALDALERYGRNSRHPAKLNMGDCFAYACAKTNNARLLYKGDDFAKTDMA